MLVRVIICWAVILTIVTAREKHGDAAAAAFDVDEDDEDHFGTANEATYLRDDFYRKRRSQEEGFYHTLLSRSEPQHVFKRSGGTEDFEHKKAMFVTERDWTGSSKISDADRKELEALFSKLNANDDGETKHDVTRSIPDDDGSVSPIDAAAYKYAAWLMAQPSHKLSAALTQKAHVDNRLTRMFFEKRGLDLLLPNSEPMTNERRSMIKKAHAAHAALHPQENSAGIQNSTAKHLIMSGPRLCTDDSAKCLCTRACYPNVLVSVSPCKCEGKSFGDAPVSQRRNATATVVTKQTVAAAPKSSLPATAGKPATFPPQAPAVVKAEVVPFPPQAPAVVKAPQAPVGTQSLLNAKKAASNVPVSLLVNGTVAVSSPVAIAAAVSKAPQVAVVAATNATAKRGIGATATGATPALLGAPQPVLLKASNLTSVEAAAAKSIEPIRSTRYFKGAPPPPVQTPSPGAAARQLPVNESAGLFGSNRAIYLDHPSYQGCFKDRKPIRDLPKRFTRFDTTPESCIMECKYQNYKFAGVQYGYLCFCGNAFGRYGRVSDKDCNSFCNGDQKRKCGAFWHNSVYSVDGRHYDQGIFDYAKVDEDERLHDELSPPPVKVVKKSSTKIDEHINSQGANAATHLVDAAQATLKAAKKLLPGVSKKHKIGKGAKRGKRDDDEDDAELMFERDNALSALKSAHNILQKTNFEKVKRSAEKEKRSISEDFDPYDPDDGKDLLKAYMSSVDAYKRQTRSVDDEEEDDGDTPAKDNFIYKRMSEAELQEGTFVDKLEDGAEAQENAETYTAKRSAEKRSAEKDVKRSAEKDVKRSAEKDVTDSASVKKRSAEKEVVVNTAPATKVEKEKRSVASSSAAVEKKESKNEEKKEIKSEEKKRSVPVESEAVKTTKDVAPVVAPVVAVVAPVVAVVAPVVAVVAPVVAVVAPVVAVVAPVVAVVAPVVAVVAPVVAPVKRDVGGDEPIEQKKAEPVVKEENADKTVKRSVPDAEEQQVDAPHEDQSQSRIKKRNLPESSHVSATTHGSGGGEYKKKRSVGENIQKVHEGSGGGLKKKRSVREGSGGMMKKRSISESIQKVHAGSGDWKKKKKRSVGESIQKIHAGSGGGDKKKRSVGESIQKIHAGSGGGDKKKRTVGDSIHMIHAGSGSWDKKKRSVGESIQKIHAGSGGGYKKKRSVNEPIQKIHASSGDGLKKKRSVGEPVQIVHNEIDEHKEGEYVNKKRRSLNDESAVFVNEWYHQLQDNKLDAKIRQTLTEASKPLKIFPVFNADSAASMKAKRDVTPQSKGTKKAVKRRKVQRTKANDDTDVGERRHIKPAPVKTEKKVEAEIPWDKKKKRRSVDEETTSHWSTPVRDDGYISRSRREVPSNNLSDGALKMAARSDDINDIEKSLQGLESIEKKDTIPEEEKPEEAAPVPDSDESGNGESEDAEEELSGDENKKLVEDNDDETRSVKKRSAEGESKSADVTKSKTSTKEGKEDGSDPKLKRDVERGVDSLLNLVVELYKQQKTIKNFENSVRTLRHDILKELKIPSKDKHAATKKVRNAIQTAAKERLHTLTSSIEHKITEFAKRHPDSVKQAKLATSLLPRIPLTDQNLAEKKREISRRSAEFDNIEDAFQDMSANQPVPDILREHFKRNAERDVEDDFDDTTTKTKRDAEKEAESREPGVTEHEKRKPRKRNSEEDVEYEPRKSDAGTLKMNKRSVGEQVQVRQTELNGEKTLSRMHRDVSESEEEGLLDDDDESDPNEDYEKLFH